MQAPELKQLFDGETRHFFDPLTGERSSAPFEDN